jgi:fatty acid desaturase
MDQPDESNLDTQTLNPDHRGTPHPFEWQTWMLIAVIYSLWVAGVMLYRDLPGWLVYPFLIAVAAWYMSLQHELIHGHPTGNRRVNRLFGVLPLTAWYPYDVYLESHLVHHRDQFLTLPGIDPESNYVPIAHYLASPMLVKGLLLCQRTMLGRFATGPALAIFNLAQEAFSAHTRASPRRMRSWCLHLVLLVLMLWVLWRVCGIAPWAYLLGVAYPAFGLAMLRSFYEHRPADLPAHRIVSNEAGLLWRLLYLNNNFHAIHHEQPTLAWYRIPQMYWADRDGYLLRNGDFLIPGYMHLFARYSLTAIDSPKFPKNKSR